MFEGASRARLWLSMLHAILLTVTCFMLFYRGYRAATYDNTMFKTYVLFEFLITSFYVFNAKYGTLCYNGIDRMMLLYNLGNRKTVFFILLENSLLALSIGMRISCLCMAVAWRVRD